MTRKKRKWDTDLAFLMFVAGMSQDELSKRFKVSASAVCLRAQADGWESKRDAVLSDRAKFLTKDVSSEQKFIRGQECRYARQLMGLAEQAIQKLKLNKPTVGDVKDLIELASKLGRLGSGLPLNQVEISTTFDLGENLLKQIERAYSQTPRNGLAPEDGKKEITEKSQVIDIQPNLNEEK